MASDESLYGVGQPNTWKRRWDEAYSQKKNWVVIGKPDDCSDYLKVEASNSSRLILTKSGQLFCQGENLRHYIDPDVVRDQLASDFVNCTDVFPIEDGDQIIDVAAGNFNTVVVTE